MRKAARILYNDANELISLKCHLHEDHSFIDKEFNSRKIPKHHVDDEEEERSTPVTDGGR